MVADSTTDTACTGQKYMMVTVLPAYSTPYSSSSDAAGIKLEIGAYDWGDYKSKFAKPAMPTLA